MKTLFTKTTILAVGIIAALFAQTANAKISKARTDVTTTLESSVKTEISNVLNNILGNEQKPAIKKNIAKQIKASALELKTNELVREVEQQLPKFKFKVVIAD